ncbi:hypothetical protein [Belnapia rosea]|uniref:hypothetical protein n=1 Tax=Belnapia rosea TaxID=938405 RepID=UPI00088511C1|nr:hypothetical protein [Belnapia rosea]SDB55747.1 hypothetical protein SAMN02927895_02142 [Belnapia rosea]
MGGIVQAGIGLLIRSGIAPQEYFELATPKPKQNRHLAANRLARDPLTREEIDEMWVELKASSDRAACVVAAAYLEVEIEKFLTGRMVQMGPNDRELIFGSQGGFLSSAMSKVRLAYAMGYIGNHTKAACTTIFDIRNIFAHSVRSVSFSTNAIKDKCDKLDYPEVCVGLKIIPSAEIENTRGRYLFTVMLMIMLISKDRTNNVVSRAQGIVKKSQDIADTMRKHTGATTLPEDIKTRMTALLEEIRNPPRASTVLP